MPYDDEDSLFEEEFDFVDDEDEGSSDNVGEESSSDESVEGETEVVEEKPKSKRKPARKPRRRAPSKNAPKAEEGSAKNSTADGQEQDASPKDEPAEEAKPAGPPTDHIVHLYEFGKFQRTIPREFTNDDAEAFAAEYNRTSGPHGRQAVAAGRDDEPAPTV